MTKKTLTALKQSIAHWTRLATGKRRNGETILGKDCALCVLYFDTGLENDDQRQCNGCPVKKRTGESFCHDSPWKEASDSEYLFGYGSPKFKLAARKELKFLKSLLP